MADVLLVRVTVTHEARDIAEALDRGRLQLLRGHLEQRRSDNVVLPREDLGNGRLATPHALAVEVEEVLGVLLDLRERERAWKASDGQRGGGGSEPAVEPCGASTLSCGTLHVTPTARSG